MSKEILKKFLRWPVQMFRIRRAKSALTQLASHKNPTLRSMGEALGESLDCEFSFEEQAWISSIEKRRSCLLRSTKEIVVIDYGAGDPGSNRAKEEMERGVQSTAIVGNVCRKGSKSPFWARVLFKMGLSGSRNEFHA